MKAEFEQADRRQWEEVSRVKTTAGFNPPSFPCRGGRKKKTFEASGEDDSGLVEFLLDASRLSEGRTGSYGGDPLSLAAATAILIRAPSALRGRSETSRDHQVFHSDTLFPAPDGKFKYHISAECNIHLAGDESQLHVSHVSGSEQTQLSL